MSNAADELPKLLASHGLTPRGALRLNPSEARALSAKSIVLIGHAGSSIWPHFMQWRQGQPAELSNPLDAWSEAVIAPIAAQFGGRAIFPFQKPFQPFQQWAMRAEGLKPSPLGILIHPVFGLWHAYRGAIAFDDDSVLIQEAQEQIHPCDLCAGKPCLSACPVDAFAGEGYAVGACRGHLASEAGGECMSGGCKARLACPAGWSYAYRPDQMQFHMRAFVK